jgi:GNAT superfamily N-acetyltransferase
MREITIREASLPDAAAIMACLGAAFEVYRERYTPEGFGDTVLTPRSAEQRLHHMTVLVAENDAAEVIGTLAFEVMRSGDGHLRGMAVLPRYQGRGVGGMLLATAESRLRELGCVRVTLDTTRALQRAMRFYGGRGYEHSGVVTDFFGMELLEYAKSLEQGPAR